MLMLALSSVLVLLYFCLCCLMFRCHLFISLFNKDTMMKSVLYKLTVTVAQHAGATPVSGLL